MTAEMTVRRPAVAGMFYPAERNVLKQQVQKLLMGAGKKPARGDVRGIISPHAGYLYSGLTAASAYATLSGQSFETVVVISPSHREYFGAISVYPGDAYRTPLGAVAIDAEMRKALVHASSMIIADDAGHREEHAIEVQLPFLQEVLGEFKLVPIVMGDQGREFCLELARALTEVIGTKNVLLVASTDLSHYHPGRVAEAIDRITIDDVQKFDFKQLMADLENKTAEACGGGPTVAVLAALRSMGVRNIEVVHHCTSGDITGDTRNVVGYLSAVAWS
jgi:MEMO1 family protein